jgi:4-hydroxybenzoate polyprenyltransferase
MKTLALHSDLEFSIGAFLRAYLVTMRPYLMFVSGITGIAGLSFGTIGPDWQSLVVALAAFLSYGFGQALTDCFQMDTDAISSPYRPLVLGELRKLPVLVVSSIGLTACVLAFAWSTPVNVLLGLIAGLGLATYTHFKRIWWSGPFYNAWIVALLFVMAALCSASVNLKTTATLSALLTVFFGYANFVLSGYFKDIEADRATGYNTLPVVRGRNVASIVSDLFAGLTILPATMSVMSIEHGRLSFSYVFLTAGIIVLIVSQILLHKVRTDAGAHRAIGLTVHGYILLLSGIAVGNMPHLTPLLILYYGLFVLTLKARPALNQI